MGNYKKIHQEITSVENQLNELIDLQHSLSDTLEQTRNEEKLFGEYLKQKYGPGKLDASTLEYITE